MLKTPLNLHNSYAWQGKRVGLLGGSFNPPHEGHLHISRIALKMLKLDAIWWLVSPQNPLKDRADYAPLADRLSQCAAILANEARMLATDIENTLGTHRSFDTINALQNHFPKTDFIFLMGRDSAQNFHKWYRWRDIPHLVPLGVLERPPAALQVQNNPLRLGSRLRHIRLSRAESITLGPGQCLWIGPHSLISSSSSEIRKRK